MIPHFVKVFDIRKCLEEAPHTHPGLNAVCLNEEAQAILIARYELLESLLQRALPLLERSKRIIAGQAPGIPHTIEGSLENLRVEIDDALTKIVMVEAEREPGESPAADGLPPGP